MSEFCKLRFDGLGTECERCGCWTRGKGAPECPPYVTRCEPDGKRLPHIKTNEQNRKARREFFGHLEAAINHD